MSSTVWDCSIVLAKYFERAKTKANQVIELGAGCGALPSLVLAKLHPSAQCIVTDKAAALPLLQKTILEVKAANIKVESLDWTEDYSGRTYATIILSDVLAFPKLYDDLLRTVNSCASDDAELYIAYERRNFEEEIEFFRQFGRAWRFEMIPLSEQDDVWQAPDSIYLYHAHRRLIA